MNIALDLGIAALRLASLRTFKSFWMINQIIKPKGDLNHGTCWTMKRSCFEWCQWDFHKMSSEKNVSESSFQIRCPSLELQLCKNAPMYDLDHTFNFFLTLQMFDMIQKRAWTALNNFDSWDKFLLWKILYRVYCLPECSDAIPVTTARKPKPSLHLANKQSWLPNKINVFHSPAKRFNNLTSFRHQLRYYFIQHDS